MKDLSNGNMLNKVPQATVFFWIIKIMATTVGETGADFLIYNFHLGLSVTSALMSVLLLAALFLQMRAKAYIPAIYWIAIVMVSIVGTLVTDNMTDNFKIPLQFSTAGFSFALMFVFIAWHASEKTLSIHAINTRKREIFYWVAILFTFALGTAAGDLTSEAMGLGYVTSTLIYGGVIVLISAAYYAIRLNPVLAFWSAYILTRPFGASCGDYLSQPTTSGGLGLGTIGTSLAFLAIILGLVSFLSITKKDSQPLPATR